MELLQSQGPQISSITSDTLAWKLFKKNILPKLGVIPSKPTRHKPPLVKELQSNIKQVGIQLIRHLSMLQLQEQWHTQLAKNTRTTMKEVFSNLTAQQDWISQQGTNQNFHMIRELASTLLQLMNLAESFPDSGLADHQLIQHYQDTYPHYFFGEEDSWSHLAVNDGLQGILSRLEALNGPGNREAVHPPTTSGNNQELLLSTTGAYFLRLHLIPLLQNQLQASVLSLKAQTQWDLLETWEQLLTITHQLNQFHSLNRLCGTWQWLIHNHQNHGDHKVVMTYPPPSQFDRMDPKPATIQVTGDTVYIQWRFPNGIIQEESLLFSEKDRALSGTFVNSVGPHGSITARKVKSCKRK